MTDGDNPLPGFAQTMHITAADIHLLNLNTRLPFKYGIATMTCAPHAFVRVRVEIDGREHTGIAADHLPPKWFTKVPEQSLESEIDDMLGVIEHAVHSCVGLTGDTAFDLWRQLDTSQADWGRRENIPPLLSNFGTTLVERALIEAVCKAAQQPFAQVVRENALGIRLEEFDDRLQGKSPGDLLPAEPRRRVIARHTIGMADPLTEEDIAEGERLNDGLPQSLAACIQTYGLRHFKIKVSGQPAADVERLTRIAAVINQHATPDFAFTLDGNEHFRDLDTFRTFWSEITNEKSLQTFFSHLMFIEQPFHRDVALDAAVSGGLQTWGDRPALIIDESDSEHDSLQRALALGYHGTSHKNCKGVFRGIINACLLEQLRREQPSQPFLLSGEDLANIGPVALLQDLTVAATLGIESVERNGHHYFAGLSAFPQPVQQQMLDHHADLYHPSRAGWPTLQITAGELRLDTLLAAPFGVGFDLDVEQFDSVKQWRAS